MSSLLTALFSAYAVQGALLAAMTLVMLGLGRRLQRRYGARWFCRVWLVLVVLFLIPLHLLVPDAPAARLTVPDALTQPRTAAGFTSDEALPRAEEAADGSFTPEDDAIPPAAVDGPSPAASLPQAAGEAGRQLPSLIEVAAGLWLSGVAAVLVWQGLAWSLWYRRVLRLRRVPDPEWQTALEDAQRQVRLRRPPRLMASAGVGGPLVTGLLRPVLLVPVQAPPREQAALMLTHELTHLRRRDLYFKLMLVLAAAVHWYDPVVWLLLHRASRDIEVACDEQENWHLQPFLWVNEKVGFWAPHTDYTHFALWRTVDGGASWEALDLSALEDEIPYDEVPGIHTCTVKLDPAHPGRVRVSCSADHSNSMYHRFYVFSDDLGENWQMDSSTEPIPPAAVQEENRNA